MAKTKKPKASEETEIVIDQTAPKQDETPEAEATEGADEVVITATAADLASVIDETEKAEAPVAQVEEKHPDVAALEEIAAQSVIFRRRLGRR